ncbi:MAG: flagellar hook-length control protein FliK [Methylococcaceae bacterium]
MDINSLISPQTLLASSRGLDNTLNLKVGQQLDVKVISADIQAAKNAITLSLGTKDITVQSNQPTTLNSGQDLKIQVTQIAPVLEFKILQPLPDPTDLRLKLISTDREGASGAMVREALRPTVSEGVSGLMGKETMQPTAKEGVNIAMAREAMQTTVKDSGTASPSPEKQSLDAKIISIVGNKIQLQFLNTQSPSASKQVAQLTIDRTQLSNATSTLTVGQNLNLEIVKAGTTPSFKIISAVNTLPDAKIAEFIKQFLPRHQAPPIFLNQLIKDLPQLVKNENIPQALKDLAVKIIQNLPPKEQLISSTGLKQAIVNSGLFLEAKLSSQAELLTALPHLIKNESVPLSLQRIAAQILQNLTQKDQLLNTPKLIPAAELATMEFSSAPKIGAVGSEDFKAHLLNFVQSLKQELNIQDTQHNQVDLDLLKNLQNKTENTVAKIVLDQLMSLPKEDSPKQLWIIDIPYNDRQQAESVRIEVQRDKANKQEYNSIDWSVNITITPPGLGTIHCLVSFRNDVINTYFKSQNGQTTELIKHHLDYLKNQLEASGLTTGQMDAHAGTLKTPAPDQLLGKKIFDDHA